MPGLYSTLSKAGSYVSGAGLGARGVQASMINRAGQAGYNMGQLGRYGASAMAAGYRGLGSTGKGAVIGAGVGGAYGMMSNDTSVLGGMMMGAGMGAAGGRYGPSAMRRAKLGYRGIGVGGAATVTGLRGGLYGGARGAYNQMRADYRGARLFSNVAANRIRGLHRPRMFFTGMA
jgi:hypothetical protein